MSGRPCLRDDISYLQGGTKRQQAAYQALGRLKVFDILAGYSPLLVGTIPLDIDTAGSDLDIICQVKDSDHLDHLDQLAALLRVHFSSWPDFSLRQRQHNQLPVVVCNFTFSGFPIEIFGQPRPVKEQRAYRHMVVEARLLSLAGPAAKEAIRRLKRRGIKTEPAFGEYFALPGDPFETLLTLGETSDEALIDLIEGAKANQDRCIFCQIVAGKAGASIVYEDAGTMAFMNLRQANQGHVLVIPRRHVEQVYDLDAGLAANLMQTVVAVSKAVRGAFQPAGLNVWQSNGEEAGQEIPHVHFHIFPRWPNDGYFAPYPELPPPQPRAILDALAERIKQAASPKPS